MVYTCPECGTGFTFRKGLTRHIHDVHEVHEVGNKEKFTCAECGKHFSTKFNLKRHSSSHSSSDPPANPPPETSSSSLPQPTPSTSGQCPPPPPPASPPLMYKCVYCGRAHRRPSGLKEHVMFAHDAIESELCSYCGEIFTREEDLSCHLSFACPVIKDCQAVQAQNVKKPHTLSLPPQVSATLISQSSSSSLPQPTPSTSGQCHPPLPPPLASAPAKYQCKYCGKSYRHSRSLRRHRKSHGAHESAMSVQQSALTDQLYGPSFTVTQSTPETRRRKFTCSECGYQLADLYSLKTHMRRKHNVGERPIFSCDRCQKSYLNKCSLIHHKKRHHSGLTSDRCPPPPPQQHHCAVCGKSFEWRSFLEVHMASCHVIGSTMSVPQITSTDQLKMTMAGASTSTATPSNTPHSPHPYGNDQPRIPPDLPVRVQHWMDEDSFNQDMSTSSSSCSLVIDCDPEDYAVDSRSSSPTKD